MVNILVKHCPFTYIILFPLFAIVFLDFPKGWDGSTALGGAVDNSKPARMLDDIRASGEGIPDGCDVFMANFEMSPDDLIFGEFMEVCNCIIYSFDVVVFTFIIFE